MGQRDSSTRFMWDWLITTRYQPFLLSLQNVFLYTLTVLMLFGTALIISSTCICTSSLFSTKITSKHIPSILYKLPTALIVLVLPRRLVWLISKLQATSYNIHLYLSSPCKKDYKVAIFFKHKIQLPPATLENMIFFTKKCDFKTKRTTHREKWHTT